MQLMKLLMTWNIIPGREQAYIEFNAKIFVPQLMQFGLQPMDSWFTLFGDVPQVTVGWVCDDAEHIRKAVATSEWRTLVEQLDDYVTDFEFRIVPVTGTFQM